MRDVEAYWKEQAHRFHAELCRSADIMEYAAKDLESFPSTAATVARQLRDFGQDVRENRAKQMDELDLA